MRTTNPRTAFAGLLAAAAAGCSSSQMGSLSVHLVDAPGDYQEINLHVLQVEVHSDATGWTTLSHPDQTYDLLKLRGGVVATLANGATLPAGDYSQVRLLLGTGNTVMLADGTVQDLDVPSGLQSGLKIVCPTHVAAGGAADVFIDFDGQNSIFLHTTGASATYILRPVIHCVEKVATGSIAGKLTTTASEATLALAGVPVTAQVLDAGGAPSIARTVTTATDGTYTLDLLPLGATYYVVTQPASGAMVFAAVASAPLALTAAAPTASYSLNYPGTVQSGGVAGAITPAATVDDADLVSAVQPLDTGGTTHPFVVRTAVPSVVSGAESYAMSNLPIGTYSLAATRRTLAGGVETVTVGAAASATVAVGSTTTVNLTVP